MFSIRADASPAPRSRFAPERDRILACAAFRRLAGKTQVLAAPLDLSLRTRLTHTLEVAATARAIGAGLGLDEALIEAIALAHDIGHPAFGHAGERALARLVPGGFHHAAHGVRVVTVLEPGLTLSPEVVDGILKHSKGKGGVIFARGPSLKALTAEALVVRAADLFAYACHDIDDACRIGALSIHELPASAVRVFGGETGSMRRVFIERTIDASRREGRIGADPEIESALGELRAFLYARLYESASMKRQTDSAGAVIELFWQTAREQPERWSRGLSWLALGRAPAARRGETAVGRASSHQSFVDAVAAMTDQQALALWRRLRIGGKAARVVRTTLLTPVSALGSRRSSPRRRATIDGFRRPTIA